MINLDGGRTGWPPGLLQDDSKRLSRWFASRPGARYTVREVFRKQHMNITIYTKSNCPNCVSAKQLLKSKGIEYNERDTDDDIVLMSLLRDHPDVRQMPQIFINDQRVGGLAGLQAALKQSGL